MNNRKQQQGSCFLRIQRRAAGAGLALAIMLAPALVVSISAQAQTFTLLYAFTGGTDGRTPLGGVTLDTVAPIAATGVDVISVGALTHSAPSLDIGLDIES